MNYRFGWILLAISLLCTASAHTDETAPARGQQIRSAAEFDYPPFSIVEKDGRANGFSVELLRAALLAMDRDVTFHVGPWAEIKGLLEQGKIDALPLPALGSTSSISSDNGFVE